MSEKRKMKSEWNIKDWRRILNLQNSKTTEKSSSYLNRYKKRHYINNFFYFDLATGEDTSPFQVRIIKLENYDRIMPVILQPASKHSNL